MKRHSFRLKNIRAFEETEAVKIASNKNRLILLLGSNASGKSTILQCLALAALGSELCNQTETDPESLLRYGCERGFIEVAFQIKIAPGSKFSEKTFCVGLEIRAKENSILPMEKPDLLLGDENAVERLNLLRRKTDVDFGFVYGYGASRTLARDPEGVGRERSKEALDRVASLFDPNFLLMDPEVLGKMLLGDLSNIRTSGPQKLDANTQKIMAKHLYKLLPEVEGMVKDSYSYINIFGTPVPINELSDGYSSLLSIICHIFRHALAISDWKGDPAKIEGIVLIDEIDLHLHPAWQRHVLSDMQEVFPNLQIIITSHSAMVAGSVQPDSISILRRDEGDIRIENNLESIEGWRADQILTSVLFDLPTSRNIQTEKLIEEYARKLRERGPEEPEVQELGKRVSSVLGLEGEGVAERDTYKLIDEVIEKKFNSLDEKTKSIILARAGLVLAKKERQE